MVYRLQPDGRYGKPDYYRRDESIYSDVFAGAEIATSLFLPAKA